MPDKLKNFNQRARKVLMLAQKEAISRNHTYVGTEHLLLGFLNEPYCTGAVVLTELGLELEKLKTVVTAMLGSSNIATNGDPHLSFAAKRAIQIALDEAFSNNQFSVNTGHLLLGLMQEETGIVAAALKDFGLDLLTVRNKVIEVLKRHTMISPPVVLKEGVKMSDKFEKFTERARKVLTLAQEEAQRFNHNYIGTEHLLLGLVREEDGVAARVLDNLGIKIDKLRSTVEFIIGQGERAPQGEIGLTPRAKKVIELAVDEAHRFNHNYIGTEHILLGLVREGEGIAAGVLQSLGVQLDKVRQQVIQVLNQSTYNPGGSARPEASGVATRMGPLAPPSGIPRRNPFPSSFGTNLAELAREGVLDPLLMRKAEIDRMLWILGRRKDPHILLVGENGVGKSELVNGLAVRLVNDPPSNFKFREFLRVNHQFLTDSRSLNWLNYNEPGLDILYVPDGRLSYEILETTHTLIYRDGVRIISGVTPREYEKILEKDPGLIRRFQIVRVEPMDEVETMQILRTKKLGYEQHHQVWIDDSALEMALLLSLKYTTDKAQPGAALDLLDEACSMVAIRRTGTAPQASSEEVIEEAFEVISESPVTALEITEVIAAITGKSVEDIEKELDDEE